MLEVFRVALLLGLTSFGGPIAHLGYFHHEYVVRRRWLSEDRYLDLVTLCQLLPGPASSQVGIGVGLLRAGWGGAFAAWLGFTLPSAVALVAFALLTTDLDLADAGWVQGLKLAAVAVVAAAIVSMWRTLAPDWQRRAVAAIAAAAMLLVQAAALQVAVIAGGALAGWLLLTRLPRSGEADGPSPVSRRAGLVALTAFVALLIGLPLAASATGVEWVSVVDRFYRAGALVFGGGHVVLPLLSESVVAPGWVSEEVFLAGYGAAQAVPGPLFTFAGFLGASLELALTGTAGAAVALAGIFLPSFLLIAAALPFWSGLRRSMRARGALAGASAAVIGLLAAALVDPVWTSAVTGPVDVGLVAVAFVALALLAAPPWLVVTCLAVGAQLLRAMGIG